MIALQQLETDIAELSAHIQAATYRLLCLVRTYDQLEGWVPGGFVSCAHWLAWRTGDDLITAREKVRVARALESLPLISAAFARAELSFSKVRAMTRIATAENEEQLLIMGAEATAAQLERIVRSVRRAMPQELVEAQLQQESRYLHYHTNEQGMLELRGLLPPEAGALLIKALEAASAALNEEGHPQHQNEQGHPQRQADALVLLAESALDHHLARSQRAERYQVVVHVDAEALKSSPNTASSQVATTKNSAESSSQVATTKNSAESWLRSELESGVGLCTETSRRLACDCQVVVLAENPDGSPLTLGRKTRRPSAALTRALKSRDRGCQWPGCTHTRYVEAHHLVHWANGGLTDLTNLVQLCSHHHRAVHEQGYRIARAADGALLFFNPQGIPLLSSPPPLLCTSEPLRLLADEHVQAQLEIDAQSGGPREFTGMPFDLGEAVALLLPLEVDDSPGDEDDPPGDEPEANHPDARAA